MHDGTTAGSVESLIFFGSMRQRYKKTQKVKNEGGERADILQLTGDQIQQEKHRRRCGGGKQRPDAAYTQDISPVAVVEVYTGHIHVKNSVNKYINAIFIVVGWQLFRCKQPEIGGKQNT